MESSIKEFIKKLDPTRDQEFIAGRNPKLSTYMDWYNGQNAWHTRKRIKGNGDVITYQREASGLPKQIAEDWASNYANEDTVITIASKNQSKEEKNNANDIINGILKKNKFFGKFNAFADKFNGLGCGATVVMPTKMVFTDDNKLVKNQNSKVKIYFLDAERVWPITVDDGEITECAFVRKTTRETILQVHILVNGKYVIGEVAGKNQADNSTPTQFDYTKAKKVYTDNDTPLFQIWHPNIGATKNMCESVYEQAIGWFKLVDTIFDCWKTEFDRGAKKRFVSAEMVDIDANGEKRDISESLDDEDIVVPMGADGKSFINEFNAELRVDQILKALVSAMNIAARRCGLGDSAFEIGDSGGRPIQTATAAILKESKLYKNIIKQENFATIQITALLLAIKEVYNTYISDKPLTFEEDDISIIYDDNIMEDTTAKKDAELKEVQAGTMSVAEFRSHWYGESVDAAKKFLQENGMLIDKYTLALQAHVITPEMFVDFVFGENYKHKKELIDYIIMWQNRSEPTISTGFEDESENNENGGKDDE